MSRHEKLRKIDEQIFMLMQYPRFKDVESRIRVLKEERRRLKDDK